MYEGYYWCIDSFTSSPSGSRGCIFLRSMFSHSILFFSALGSEECLIQRNYSKKCAEFRLWGSCLNSVCVCVGVSAHAHACVGCTQSCSAICSTMDSSPPGSSTHVIFQARILEQVIASYSRGSSQPRDWTHVSCVSCLDGQILYH